VTISELSERFDIPPELVAAAGVRHLNDVEVPELLGVHGWAGQDLSGIVFPYRDPRDRRVLGHRVRLDAPLADNPKYLSEQGCRALFFAPLGDAGLNDTSVPVVIVEAEKSALALKALADRHGLELLSIAVGGVYGWKRRVGTEPTPNGDREAITGPSPSFDWLAWQGRKVIVAFDSNVAGRRDLERARLGIVQEMQKRGAQVFIASVPKRKDVNGPDDLIAVSGDPAALEMLDRAGLCSPKSESRPSQESFSLMRLADLLNRPDTLCFAVARGDDFLGIKTKKGECIYLALEERPEDIRNDFRAMGADGSESIYVHAATAPSEGMLALCRMVRERKPVLVVVDPLFRLARIRDEKAYAETYAALGPLIDVARETGTHVMLVHHAGKGMKTDAVDSPLGSTAIGGAVSTLIILKRLNDHRTIETVQRVGKDLPETILAYDAESRRLGLGGSRFDPERQECEAEILEFIQSANEPRTQEQIRDSIEAQTKVIRAALTSLVKSERVAKAGEGKRGSPFLYSFPNSGSEHTVGTTKPEYRKTLQVPENKARTLVPENPFAADVVPEIQDGEETVRI
jgi:AAA domain-containing protein/uncharacterized protein DUF3854